MPDRLPYECLTCGTVYADAGESGCPDCGARNRRYIGQVEPHPHPKHWGSA